MVDINEAAAILGVPVIEARVVLKFHGVEGENAPAVEGEKRFGKPKKLYPRAAVEGVKAKQ